MKINSTAAFQAYNRVAEYAHAPRHAEHHQDELQQRGENTDQIQISAEGARKMELEQLTKSVVAQVREPASAQRLESLRSAVQNKTYHVPTNELVDALMNWFTA